MRKTPQSAKIFVGLVAICSLGLLGFGLKAWESVDLVRFVCFLLLSVAASRMKLSLPGLNGNMSVNVPFLLLSVVELSLPQALLIALASVVTQCLPKGGKKMAAIQAIFNIATIVNAVGLAYFAAHSILGSTTVSSKPLELVLAVSAFFLANTIPVALVLYLAESGPAFKMWREMVLLTFPYFVLSAGLCSLAATATMFVGWKIPLAMFPVMAITHLSYRRYFSSPAKAETAPGPIVTSAAAD